FRDHRPVTRDYSIKIHLEDLVDGIAPVRPTASIRVVDDHGDRVRGGQQVAQTNYAVRREIDDSIAPGVSAKLPQLGFFATQDDLRLSTVTDIGSTGQISSRHVVAVVGRDQKRRTHSLELGRAPG